MTKDYKRLGAGVVAPWIFALLAGALLGAPQALRAQTPTRSTPARQRTLHKPATPPGADQPKFKGIFEPVNYNQDLNLNDVFFVSDDEGWVSGEHGTILHTTDGGKTWTAQLGGDPQGTELGIIDLRFLDARHGWAVQGVRYQDPPLLRTVDGQNWQRVGHVAAGEGYSDYIFISPTTGFVIEGNIIRRTLDAGSTWKDVFKCSARVEVSGLTREMNCGLGAIAFPTPTVGYVIGEMSSRHLVVCKTQDGGNTWQVALTPNVFDTDLPRSDAVHHGVYPFFKDANTGVVAFWIVNSGKVLFTTDGGQNWQTLPSSLMAPIRFADPEVGWSFLGDQWSYTTNGGRRWSSRTLRFPAGATAYSLPSRRRGYFVGGSGMIYRYRVVPVTYQAVAHSIDAPAMPGFDSPVFGEVATLNDVVAKLRAKLPAVAALPSQAAIQSGAQPAGQIAAQPIGQTSVQTSAQAAAFQQDTNTPSSIGAGAAAAGAPGGFQQDASGGPVPGGYMDSCCGPLIQQLETTTNSFATNVPTFSQRFRNLNLIFEGLNFLNSIVNQTNTLKQSVRALRQAKNPQAASAALTTVQTQVNGISSSGGFVQDVSTPLQP